MFRQNQDMIRSNYICKSYDKSDKCEIEKQEINKEAKTDFSSESQIIKTEKSRSIVENESQVNSEMDKISQETIKENFPFLNSTQKMKLKKKSKMKDSDKKKRNLFQV